MFKILLILLIVVPAAEIAVLILAGQWVGIWPTLGLILLTGFLGAWLAKKEGMQVLRLVQLETGQGRVPSGVLLDGVCILAGGLLLLTPGFITDGIGFFLLLPQTRGLAKGFMIKIFERGMKNGSFIFISRR